MAKDRFGLAYPARIEGARRGELATLGLLARGARLEAMAGTGALVEADRDTETVAMYESCCLWDQHAPVQMLSKSRCSKTGSTKEGLGRREARDVQGTGHVSEAEEEADEGSR